MGDITLIEVALSFAVVSAIWLLGKGIPTYKENKYRLDLYEKVGWIAEKENHWYGCCNHLRMSDLSYYIMQEQNDLNISEEFRIDYNNENEKKNIEDILEGLKNEVIKDYFYDKLAKSKLVYKCTSLEYFMYRLYLFIDYNLENYEYIKEEKIYKDREYTDKTRFNCQLTEYGRVYYKLYLITLLFIEKHEAARKLFKYINPKLKDNIMGYLKNN